jgi:hypothetical protein
MLNRFLPVLITTLLSGFYTQAQSSYRSSLQDFYYANSISNHRFAQRMSIGVGKYFITGKADLHYQGYTDSFSVDTFFRSNLRSNPGFVFHAGSYFPIAIISDHSMLVLQTEIFTCWGTLVYDSVVFSNAGDTFMKPFQYYRIGVPISLEYRFGGDVTLNKNHKAFFTIGGGICPSYVNSNNFDTIRPLKLAPFLKAEAGFFPGIAVKLRATIFFGNYYYKSFENWDVMFRGSDYLRSSFKASTGYGLSVILMPFSVNWNK